MALAAAVVLAFHLRLSLADRRAVPGAIRAATIRHLFLYALVVIGLLWAAFTIVNAVGEIWRRLADVVVVLPSPPIPERQPGAPPPPAIPSRDDFLRFELLGAIPAMVAGFALWLGTWLPLQRGLWRAPDSEVERRSVVRKLAVYVVIFVSALAVLFSATVALSDAGRRLLGDPIVEGYSSLWHDIGPPLVAFAVFGALWLFHRRVIEGEAAREPELARAATIRRLYIYLISAIGLAMAAFGVAGTIGVAGSLLFALGEHEHAETAAYVALVLVGGAAWGFHWRQARRRLDDDERRSQPRRLYLYLAVFGGVVGLLVFGSAALYRLLNATLALSFARDTWHDVWHFGVDSTVSAAVAWWSFRALRADRGVLGAAGEETYAVTVLVRAADRDAARTRVERAIAGEPDVSVKR